MLNFGGVPKIAIFKGSYLLQTIIFRIHVSFRECNIGERIEDWNPLEETTTTNSNNSAEYIHTYWDKILLSNECRVLDGFSHSMNELVYRQCYTAIVCSQVTMCPDQCTRL